MAGFCKAMIIGNLGRDPEMRYTPNGKPVTTFSVAVSRKFTTSDGAQREETQWFRVNAWNKLAETCNEFLSKGRKVFVEGRLQVRTWEGQDGEKRTSVEIVASDVVFVDRLEKATLAAEEGVEAEETEAEDLPF